MKSGKIGLGFALLVAGVAPTAGQTFPGQNEFFDSRAVDSQSSRSAPAMDRWKESGIDPAAGLGGTLDGRATGQGAGQSQNARKLFGDWQKEVGGAMPGGRLGAPGVRAVGGAILPGGYVPGTSLSGVAPGEALGGGRLH
jgi:hypothetical protein